MSRKIQAATLVASLLAVPASAGIVVYEDGDKFVEIGFRVQFQYHRTDTDGGPSEDEFFFRRLRPYIEGTVTENWEGKLQFDLGKAEDTNEVAVKDAYMMYKGFENLELYIGNTNTPFSREMLTSSKKQHLVERTFTGDHNYGSPDRQLGFRLDGHNESNKIEYSVALGSESVDPDAARLDFDSPVNRNSDFNDGIVIAGRVDFHPLGYLEKNQHAFSRERKFTIGLAVFSWTNDDDNNTYTDGGVSTSSSKADVDSADGFEVSAAFRAAGWSIDAQINTLSADLVDDGFTGGLFRNGTTDLDVTSLEGGYMFPNNRFELVGGFESLDADNYQDSWDRTSFGFNTFWNKEKVKLGVTFRQNSNVDGVRNADADELFVQWQFVM